MTRFDLDMSTGVVTIVASETINMSSVFPALFNITGAASGVPAVGTVRRVNDTVFQIVLDPSTLNALKAGGVCVEATDPCVLALGAGAFAEWWAAQASAPLRRFRRRCTFSTLWGPA